MSLTLTLTEARELGADEVTRLVFDQARDPRSRPYREGVHYLLARQLGAETPCPAYRPGTAECDAFYAGVAEGWTVLRDLGVSATS